MPISIRLDTEIPGDVFVFEIFDDDDEIIGILEVTKVSPTTLNIENINAESLGIQGIRRIRDLLIHEFPGVREVTGRRISGVRARGQPIRFRGVRAFDPEEAPKVRARLR